MANLNPWVRQVGQMGQLFQTLSRRQSGPYRFDGLRRLQYWRRKARFRAHRVVAARSTVDEDGLAQQTFQPLEGRFS